VKSSGEESGRYLSEIPPSSYPQPTTHNPHPPKGQPPGASAFAVHRGVASTTEARDFLQVPVVALIDL